MKEWIKTSKSSRAKAAIVRFRGQAAIETPEGKLMFAIFAQAIRDLVAVPKARSRKQSRDAYNKYKIRIEGERRTAKAYLSGKNGNMIHAQLCGLDPEWITKTLLDMNLWPSRGNPV